MGDFPNERFGGRFRVVKNLVYLGDEGGTRMSVSASYHTFVEKFAFISVFDLYMSSPCPFSILFGFKGGINVGQIDACAYMVRQFVILLVFEVGVIKSCGCRLGQAFSKFVQNYVVVQNTVKVTSPAFVIQEIAFFPAVM